MPATGALADRFVHETRLRRLVRIGVAPVPAGDTPLHLFLLQERKGLSSAPVALPAGAATRRLDGDGRIKLGGDLCLSELLGWAPGALEVRCDGRWLVLTQPADLVGARRTRDSSHATFSSTPTAKGAVERLALPPAQRQRVTSGSCASVLAIPVPGNCALLLVNPVAVLEAAPEFVRSLVTADDRDPVTGGSR